MGVQSTGTHETGRNLKEGNNIQRLGYYLKLLAKYLPKGYNTDKNVKKLTYQFLMCYFWWKGEICQCT